MGRRLPTAKELLSTVTARGYEAGVHREKDIIKEVPKYVKKTLKDQNWALNCYVKWTEGMEMKKEKEDGTAEIDSARTEYHLWKGAPYPKNYGLLEQLSWIRTVLTREHLVVNKKKPKHLFGKHDLIQFYTTFWTKDDTNFVHPRNKLQILFIIDVFCWTEARIGVFFPNPDNKDEGGLRYKDIEVVFYAYMRAGKYGAFTSQHAKLIFDDTQYLLALAFADKAFFEIDSPEKFWQFQIPEGKETLILR
ncbi:MAG: hypothetical protein M1840_007159 [Geoglossum simile]|nr:MAG: hypothetical protein M1840_007159 [Geoglossum simile]